MRKFILHGASALLFGSMVMAGSSVDALAASTIAQLQDRWAQINYQLKDDAQIEAFNELETQADQFVADNPSNPEGWIWRGIIKSTHAGAQGGLGALKLAKAARSDLEKAIEIDPVAMNGSALTSLGTLYFSVPGWPVGFGSDKKAKELLQRGLEANPNGIDSNYFYAEYLRDKGKLEDARAYYLKAKSAAPRPGRLSADQGRQQEIQAALVQLDSKLKK